MLRRFRLARAIAAQSLRPRIPLRGQPPFAWCRRKKHQAPFQSRDRDKHLRSNHMHTVTESIYNGKSVIIPLADVQHIEKWDNHTVPGIKVITKHTRWDHQADIWA